MGYPDAPWPLHGQLWVSLFRVGSGDAATAVGRAPGVYGAAWLSYEHPSPLTYGELLVARPVSRAGGRRVEITDIWVDSVDSRDGGRDLWAIPKDLADFDVRQDGGRVRRTSWAAHLEGRPVASARFTDVSSLAPRLPFRASTWQVRASGPEAGQEVVAPISGSGRALPCRGTWDFDAEGPLAWLRGKRPLASFRMVDFSLSFG